MQIFNKVLQIQQEVLTKEKFEEFTILLISFDEIKFDEKQKITDLNTDF